MTVNRLFEVAAGSVPGRDHQRAGRNNQDAWAWSQSPQALVAVVCDGCGSGRHSEVGAQLGARMAEAAFRRRAPVLGEDPRLWGEIGRELLGDLRGLARTLGGCLAQTVAEYLLFTIVGVVVNARFCVMFSLGDGLVYVNGQRVGPGRASNNAPAYLAYGLLAPAFPGLGPPAPRFQVFRTVPTAEVRSVVIGTDGAEDLAAVADRTVPGKAEGVGPLSQFWTDDGYFRNPDLLRRRLTQVNREAVKADPGEGGLKREPGLLPDDTTLVVIRRRRGAVEELDAALR